MDFDSNSEQTGSEHSDYDSEEDRPTFVPKSQRTTLEDKRQQDDEDRLRAEKRQLEQKIRKDKTRAELAENIRKATEGTEQTDADGYDSERDLPDCSDNKLDLTLEVIGVLTCS